MICRIRLAILPLALGLAACQTPRRYVELGEAVSRITDRPEFRHAFWGLLVRDLESGELLYEKNRDRLFHPASTAKLFSVATALHYLGPDYRFRTTVRHTGTIEDGVLTGDLILVASGDLTMGGRTTDSGEIAFTNSDHIYANGGTSARLTEPDPLAGIAELARQIRAAGVRELHGRVLVDDRLFEHDESTGSGPTLVTPIMVNDNLIDVTITPTAPGRPATLDWRPKSHAYSLINAVTTAGENDSPVLRITSAGNVLQVIGRIPAGHDPVVRVYEVDDPAKFAATLLREALETQGVGTSTTNGTNGHAQHGLPSREHVAGLPTLATLVSPPFSQNARLILKVSHNLHASTLPLLVAANNGGRTLSDGLHLQHGFLAGVGIDVDDISFAGAAGGARADYLTPEVTVQLLRYIATTHGYERFRTSLPILGVDGTLADVVSSSSPARGKVWAKTGTYWLRNTMNQSSLLTSKALAGYMQTRSGKNVAFAMFVNGVPLGPGLTTKTIGERLGRLCEVFHDSL